MTTTTRVAHDLGIGDRTKDVIINEDITFESLFLLPQTRSGLKKSGFEKPSPIQLKAIPLGKCGFDLIIEAKSGTGKTAVCVVIALESLAMDVGCQCIILAPTREIAVQIGQVFTSIGADFEGLSVEVIIGGTDFGDDLNRLRGNNYHVLIGTPGRMKHLIKINAISLDTVRMLILDEADRLVDASCQKDVNYIFSKLPPRKQVFVMSATYSEEMREFLNLYMETPLHVHPYSSAILLGVAQFIAIVSNHKNMVRQNQIIFSKLIEILSSTPFKQCLIFCNYQVRTREIWQKLLDCGWPAECLASAQTQSQRLNSLRKLQMFECRILVATDLASRGIDAANVDLVINLENPYDMPTYLHRIGRCGRYGSRGTAITILPVDQEQKFKNMLEILGDSFHIKHWKINSNDDNIEKTAPDSLGAVCNETSISSISLLPLFVHIQKTCIPPMSFEFLAESLNTFRKEYQCPNTKDKLKNNDNKQNVSNKKHSGVIDYITSTSNYSEIEKCIMNVTKNNDYEISYANKVFQNGDKILHNENADNNIEYRDFSNGSIHKNMASLEITDSIVSKSSHNQINTKKVNNKNGSITKTNVNIESTKSNDCIQSQQKDLHFNEKYNIENKNQLHSNQNECIKRSDSASDNANENITTNNLKLKTIQPQQEVIHHKTYNIKNKEKIKPDNLKLKAIQPQQEVIHHKTCNITNKGKIKSQLNQDKYSKSSDSSDLSSSSSDQRDILNSSTSRFVSTHSKKLKQKIQAWLNQDKYIESSDSTDLSSDSTDLSSDSSVSSSSSSAQHCIPNSSKSNGTTSQISRKQSNRSSKYYPHKIKDASKSHNEEPTHTGPQVDYLWPSNIEEYKIWRQQLQFTVTCIEQSVYLNEINK